MTEMTPEQHAYKRDRMADFFVRCENGWMTHELMAKHLMETLASEPDLTYEGALAKLYAKAPTQEALKEFARSFAQQVGERMGLAGYGDSTS